MTPEKKPGELLEFNSPFVRKRDIIASGLVYNAQTLRNWIKFRNFPPGKLSGNARIWRATEIIDWFESLSSENQIASRKRHLPYREQIAANRKAES